MRWFVVGVVGFLAIGLGYNSPAYERTCKAQKGEKKSDEGEDHGKLFCAQALRTAAPPAVRSALSKPQLDEIGSGVMSFFSKTKEEVLGQRAGLGSGVSDLAEGIFGGALGSFAKVSGSLKDTVGSSLGEPMGSDRKALNLTEGLDLGYASIATGISEGISAVVKEPFKQANEDGLVGLASGVALGAASAVVRPMEGLLGAVEKLSQGAEGEVRGRYRGYGGLRRPPRAAFHPEAHGLQALAESFFWPMWLLHVRALRATSSRKGLAAAV
ncbi:tipC [Symbiodinium natans]|uniref:TipC protein n=1 Tax=Symbiodinium natans TaxID=878477 RepID=A0A812N955_9DINO|nr:tipC [Symbiodinium natans]